jgi:hypothetical protein
MQHPEPAAEVIHFTCNICGASNSEEAKQFHRELAVCRGCTSNARFRGIILALSRELLGRDAVLKDVPRDPSIRGLGLSDAPAYASWLARKFRYINTSLISEPQLDLRTEDWKKYRNQDFIICADVLEHVPQPLDPIFQTLRSMLRPGGVLVLTVPYADIPNTIEHYPGLKSFRVLEKEGRKTVEYLRTDGTVGIDENPIFHGGEGSTLELRVFSQGDVLAYLYRAGFEDIRLHDEPEPGLGYYWPPMPERPSLGRGFLGYTITARRPELRQRVAPVLEPLGALWPSLGQRVEQAVRRLERVWPNEQWP